MKYSKRNFDRRALVNKLSLALLEAFLAFEEENGNVAYHELEFALISWLGDINKHRWKSARRYDRDEQDWTEIPDRAPAPD